MKTLFFAFWCFSVIAAATPIIIGASSPISISGSATWEHDATGDNTFQMQISGSDGTDSVYVNCTAEFFDRCSGAALDVANVSIDSVGIFIPSGPPAPGDPASVSVFVQGSQSQVSIFDSQHNLLAQADLVGFLNLVSSRCQSFGGFTSCDDSYSIDPALPTPEPGTLATVLSGFGAFVALGKRRALSTSPCQLAESGV